MLSKLAVLVAAASVVGGVTSSTSAATLSEIRDDVGWTALSAQLGGSMPSGAGVTISQIEASDGGNYYPGSFGGKTITDVSGFNSTQSTHANTVAQHAYGPSGLAPGVTTIDSYSVDGQTGNQQATAWLQDKGLKIGQANDPVVETRDVQIHAWVGSVGGLDNDALLRHDYQIRRDDFVAVVGVQNAGFGDYQPLLANGMNSISVGVSSGNHVERTGANVRPLIVAPADFTSYATGTVAGGAAMLIQAAGGPGNNGSRSETIKAVLLAGATKSEFPSWSRTDTRPLDSKYGAGELNVQNSYNIIAAGEHESSDVSTVTKRGFDYSTATNPVAKHYFFDVAAGETDSLSVALAWNVNATSTGFSLSNLNLRLFSATGFFITTPGSPIQQSVAAGGGSYSDYTADVWNVEHLWLPTLTPGRYAIEVTNDSVGGVWNYSLAWNAQAVPEPAAMSLLMIAGVALLRRRVARGER